MKDGNVTSVVENALNAENDHCSSAKSVSNVIDESSLEEVSFLMSYDEL